MFWDIAGDAQADDDDDDDDVDWINDVVHPQPHGH